MSLKKAGLALLVALLLAPAVNAQVTVTSDEELTSIDPEGTATIAYTATIGCSDLVPGVITGGGSQDETLDFTYPDGLTGPDSQTVTFSGTPCASNPSGSTTATGTLDITALPEARGMTTLPIAAANGGDSAGELPVEVGYQFGHTLTFDVDFPLEVGADPVTWNATLTVTANADTMVMTLGDEKAQFGSVAGIFTFKNFRDIPAEGMSETMTFTYTPSSQGWETDNETFTLWSHYIEDGTMKTPDETIQFSFVNTQSQEEDDSKGSPGFGPVALVGLLGAAAVAMRRRS